MQNYNKKNPKNFKKPLDKPVALWYNSIRKGEVIPQKKRRKRK